MEEKVKTLDFSGSAVACDLKVAIHHIELMKLCVYSTSMSFLDQGQRAFTD